MKVALINLQKQANKILDTSDAKSHVAEIGDTLRIYGTKINNPKQHIYHISRHQIFDLFI